MFNKYAVTLGRAESIISETKEPVGSNFYTDRVSLKQFLQLPMKKLTDYLATFNEILDESFSNGGTMTSLFKHCAVIEVEFNQLHRRTMENYRLYALRDERVREGECRSISLLSNSPFQLLLLLADALQNPWSSGTLGCGLLQCPECLELQVVTDQDHVDLRANQK